MFRTAIALASALLTVSGTVSASAATMQATWTGWIAEDSSRDDLGLFGGGSLDGLGYRIVFVFDPETPGATRETRSDLDSVTGGTFFGTVTPLRSARLTINAHTVAFNTGQNSLVQNSGSQTMSRNVTHGTTWGSTTGNRFSASNLSAVANNDTGAFPLNLDLPIALTQLSDIENGGFSIFKCTLSSTGCDPTVITQGNFNPTSLRVSQVPLPAALPLLACGAVSLGFLGLRRRRGPMAA
jgi:hypothetical protein